MKKVIVFFVVLLLCYSGIASASLTDGLVAYYPFNGNANDASLNGNNGVVHGAMLTTDRFGNPDSAYNFNGVNDYINILDNNSLDLSTAGTLTAFIKADPSIDLSTPGGSGIISKMIGSYQWQFSYYMYVHPAGILHGLVTDGTSLSDANMSFFRLIDPPHFHPH